MTAGKRQKLQFSRGSRREFPECSQRPDGGNPGSDKPLTAGGLWSLGSLIARKSSKSGGLFRFSGAQPVSGGLAALRVTTENAEHPSRSAFAVVTLSFGMLAFSALTVGGLY